MAAEQFLVIKKTTRVESTPLRFRKTAPWLFEQLFRLGELPDTIKILVTGDISFSRLHRAIALSPEPTGL